MDKKVLAILIVAIAICSTTSVFAIDLSDTQDFDGFKMKVATNDNFTKVANPILKANNFYKNANDTIFVLVYDADVSVAVNEMSKGNLSIINSASGKNGVINEDKLFMFNATDNMTKDIGDYNITSFVAIEKGNNDPNCVVICGNDAKVVKDYAKTVVFN